MIQTYISTLIKKEEIAPEVYLLRFKLKDETQTLTFKAGQYLILKVPQENTFISRLFSIASAPSESTTEFELIVKFETGGIASTYLDNMKENDQATFQGPAGLFVVKNPELNKVFLITGTGIAPVYSMLYDLVAGPKEVINYIFWGVPTIKDLYLAKELLAFEKDHPHIKIFFCLSREKSMENVPVDLQNNVILGRVTVGYEQTLPVTRFTLKDWDHYLCGNRDVVESLRLYLSDKGTEKERVIFEKF